MKEIKVKSIPDDNHWIMKVEAAKRQMTLKEFIMSSTGYVIENKVKLK